MGLKCYKMGVGALYTTTAPPLGEVMTNGGRFGQFKKVGEDPKDLHMPDSWVHGATPTMGGVLGVSGRQISYVSPLS